LIYSFIDLPEKSIGIGFLPFPGPGSLYQYLIFLLILL